MSLHDEIMSLPVKSDVEEFTISARANYKQGHRDARHAAAELAIKYDQDIERVKADLDRLHRERDAFQEQCRVMAEENARIKAVLNDAHLLSMSWALYYQSIHDLSDFLPAHKKIIDACCRELGLLGRRGVYG